MNDFEDYLLEKANQGDMMTQEKGPPQSEKSEPGSGLVAFLRRALSVPGNRRPLYFILPMFGLWVILDSLDWPLEQLVGVIAGVSTCLYLGFLILAGLPPGSKSISLYRLLGIGFIAAGVFILVVYVADRTLLTLGYIE